ncbi:hypothetical protein NDU88_006890 [Pleurodeles waltl]|uniref:Secreted protein n=1 Tax=Pleurodeles waltl TaxID=8319 RepID=A0AAV7LW65_PLEWA|nr:hypothetical protein NDU88_006890 [Pleurodeles waltl]
MAGNHRRGAPQVSLGLTLPFSLQHSSPVGPSSLSQPRRVHPAVAAIFTTPSRDRPGRRTKAERRLSTRSPQLTSHWAPGTPGSHE